LIAAPARHLNGNFASEAAVVSARELPASIVIDSS